MKDELTFQVEEEEISSNHSQFAIGPLEDGYGHTLGTALRRVLLSSLPGAAITKVQFDGAQHQFTSLPGVKEDLVRVVLKLKKIRFRSQIEDEATISVDKSGPGEITAGDIETPADLEVVNEDLVIAHLADEDSHFKAEMTVAMGEGYLPVEEQPDETLGTIKVDALFSPIEKVDYEVQETRVGRESNYDLLVLDVWTDGSIEVKDAVEKAAKILSAYFNQVYDPNHAPLEEETEKEKEPEVLQESVAELGLPTRTQNALERGGYKTIGDLAEVHPEDLLEVKNIGQKSVELIEEALEDKEVDWS